MDGRLGVTKTVYIFQPRWVRVLSQIGRDINVIQNWPEQLPQMDKEVPSYQDDIARADTKVPSNRRLMQERN